MFLINLLVSRKQRRSTPTAILVQLSTALTGLLLVLYIAEAVATSSVGCQVANILRYYLVMVSLLWNAVEAVNMYLMLVKVFNSEVNRFVLKAAITAWGKLVLKSALGAWGKLGGKLE